MDAFVANDMLHVMKWHNGEKEFSPRFHQAPRRSNEITLELNGMCREWDLLKYRSCGYVHSFGVSSHCYSREAGVELREDIDTELKSGMVVSMEPMVLLPEGTPGAGGYPVWPGAQYCEKLTAADGSFGAG